MNPKPNRQLKKLVIGPMKITGPEWSFIKNTNWDSLAIIDGGEIHLPKLKLSVNRDIFSKKRHFGDGDSSLTSPHFLKKDQNISDLSFYLDNINSLCPHTSFAFFGFLGGRIDHQLFNFGSWLQALDKLCKVHKAKNLQFFVGSDIIILSKGIFNLKPKGPFSLLVIKPCSVKLQGLCQYPLNSWTHLKTLDSRTLSNQSHGEISLATKGSLILYAKNLLRDHL
jgi:thiamine pyrophosphokinase